MKTEFGNQGIGRGTQSIEEIELQDNHIIITFRHYYTTKLTLDETKQLVQALNQAITELEQI